VVWLYVRFSLSYRDAEEPLFARGVTVTCEAPRKWCRKFGPSHAKQLRRQQPRPGDKWHLDEVFLTMRGRRHYFGRAVDQDGHVLDNLGQPRRDKKAVKKFFRKLLKGCQYIPCGIITDKLKSHEAAKQNSCLVWNIASIAISITARKTHTSPPGGGRGACSDSNLSGRPSVSSQLMVQLGNTSARGATSLPPLNTGKR
jgi:transposase-like protein